MPLFAFEGREPQVSPGAWIAPTAILVGDVRVEAEASVWYGAVLRADFGPIVVRRGANIQDGSVLHGGDDPVTEIGEGATVGHLCVVHGAVIGTEALVGNGATVLDGVVVGRRALIAAGATVPPGMVVPDGMIAVGVPARVGRRGHRAGQGVGGHEPRRLPRAGPAARVRRPARRVGVLGISRTRQVGSAGLRASPWHDDVRRPSGPRRPGLWRPGLWPGSPGFRPEPPPAAPSVPRPGPRPRAGGRPAARPPGRVLSGPVPRSRPGARPGPASPCRASPGRTPPGCPAPSLPPRTTTNTPFRPPRRSRGIR